MDIWKELRDEGVDSGLLDEVRRFREAHPLTPEAQERVPVPKYLYYGREVWESAAAALLCGEHLLLAGPKATGKNVLAEDLAALFGRPVWDVSMYVNVDAAALIGADTLKDGQVVFREGPVCACARLGGFGVLDEVNMAKNEALAVLHATLDHRRVIDVPGYERIQLDDAARFIGTMNYGYAGTRELNEALVSRFVVVDMPVISDENLQKLLRRSFPTLKREWAEQLTALFRDLRTKCDSGEISTKALDLRGLLAALHLIEKGIPSGQALDLGIINNRGLVSQYRAQVWWDLSSTGYDPFVQGAQVLTVRGTAVLPEETGNDNALSLEVSIKVFLDPGMTLPAEEPAGPSLPPVDEYLGLS